MIYDAIKIIERMIENNYVRQDDAYKYHYASINYMNKLDEELYALSEARVALIEKTGCDIDEYRRAET